MTDDTLKPTIYPILRYADAPAAIRFLTEVFGLTEHLVVPGEDGTIAHAQLSWGPCMVMLGSKRDDDYGELAASGRVGLYLAVADVDAHHDRVVAAGAEILRPLADTDYGSREYTTGDPEGNLWSFGSYQPSAED